MQNAVKEGVEPEHSAKLTERSLAGDPAQRSDSQRQYEEEERQHSGCTDGEVNWIGAKTAEAGIPAQQRDRHNAVQQDDSFGEPIDLHVSPQRPLSTRNWPANPCRCTSEQPV